MIFGYLDPGTGGLIIQAVLGGVAGIALFFRSRFRRFSRKRSKSSIHDQGSGAADALARQERGPDA